MSLHDLRRKLSQKHLRQKEDRPGVSPARKEPNQPGRLCQDYQPTMTSSQEDLETILHLETQGFVHVPKLRKLDPHQLSCVLWAGSAVVTAPVGSGKTTVLIQKIVHLVAQGVAPEKILVFTFTRKAAREIHQRLLAIFVDLDWTEIGQPDVGTFHSLAFRLISKSEITDDPSSQIEQCLVLDVIGQMELLSEIIDRLELNILYRKKLIRRVEMYRLGQMRFGNMKRDDDMAVLMSAYAEEKILRNLLDYDDLVSRGTSAAAKLADDERPAWILIDELQDTDNHQMALIEAWRTPRTRLFSVGDPDQMIYSWRGTQEDVFSKFQESWQAKAFTLTRNYRSTVNILEAARFVLSVGRLGGPLIPARTEVGNIFVEGFHDVVSETCFLASTLRSQGKGKTQAILVRTRSQIEPLREQLALAGFDVFVRESGAAGLNLRSFCLAYLRWLSEPDRSDQFLDWTIDSEFGFAKLRGHSVTELRRSDDFSSYLDSQGTLNPSESAGILRRLREIRATWKIAEGEEGRGTWIASSGILNFLHPLSSNSSVFSTRLHAWFGRLSHLSGTPTAAFYLSRAIDCLLSLEQEEFDDPSSETVEILTMHGAKGLEYDQVFISGVNAGLVPLRSSDKTGDSLAEERRLLFVAMTRAKDSLFISWHKDPAHAQAKSQPSPFLDLIPDQLIDEMPADPPNQVSDRSWGPGLMIKHKRYGDGVVVSYSEGQVCCEFENFGAKTFPSGMCPLIRL